MSDADPLVFSADDLVAVVIPGLALPLYGTVAEVDGPTATVVVTSKRGTARIECSVTWLRPWHPRRVAR